MKKTFSLIWIFLFVFILSCSSFCEEVAVRDWAAFSGIDNLTVNNDTLSFNTKSQMPLLSSKDNLFINANRFNVLLIKMKTNGSYQIGRLFFKRIGDRDFSHINSFQLQLGLGNMYHNYLLDLSGNPNWYGVITQMMFSPINEEGVVEVDSFKLLEPNPFLKTSVLWQEFFSFEMPQLRSVNFIYGPKINKLSVNLFIYFLIAALSVIIFSIEFIRSRDFGITLSKSSKKIIIACLVFWMLLDMRIMFDQIRTAILDTQLFFGKTLDTKRALTTLGDFYGFVSFSNSKMPSGSSFNLIAPTNYYFREKSVYYLYPIFYDDNAEYILVYNPDGSLGNSIGDKIKIGYKVYATYKEGEFILRK